MGKFQQRDELDSSPQNENRSAKFSHEFPPRTKFSFEDQLTFVPKLNSISMKLAETNRTSIIHRSKKQKKENGNNVDFLFKPKVSKVSNRIAEKLKTGFWDRQNIHVQHQKEKLENGPSTIHPNLRHSPIPKVKDMDDIGDQASPYFKCANTLLVKAKTEDCKKSTFKEKKLSKSLDSENLVSGRSKNYTFRSGGSFSVKSIIENKDTLKQQNEDVNQQYLPSLKQRCLTPTGTVMNPVIQNPKGNLKRCHVRSLTFPQRTDELDSKHQQLLSMKKVASDAAQNNKIFICSGPYATLRAALRRRGWIEKNFKQDKRTRVEIKTDLNCDHNANSTSSETQSRFLCDGHYGIMSRIVRNTAPSFIWTLRNDEINYQFLNKDQIVNHYMCAGSFTTKSGLCASLKNAHYFVDIQATEFFPRCYRLCCNEEQQEFIADFRITAVTSMLRIILSNYEEWKNLENDEEDIVLKEVEKGRIMAEDGEESVLKEVEKSRIMVEDGEDTMLKEVEKGRIMVEDGEDSVLKEVEKGRIMAEDKEDSVLMEVERTSMMKEDEANTVVQDSPASVEANYSELDQKILPVNVIHLIIKACHHFLDSKEHLHIEEGYDLVDRDINEITWTMIINYYYEIAHKNSIITNAWLFVEKCQNIFEKMIRYCPQISIDGCQNLWILKPGAKSRGRGIELKNRLDDVLNVVNGISNKENKWVIQKYIERPFLVYKTKFDIRQWFLVTDWNPLMLWFYKDSYIRFCGQEFTLDKFGPQFHLSNNSVQRHYKLGERSEHLPDSNMWSSEEFQSYLIHRGFSTSWDKVIYPGMKDAIIAVLQSCQDSLEYRKNAFELYGADFMLTEDLKPWLIEVNSSPALGASTPVTEILCRNVIEDALKVVLDRRENKLCDTGRFELVFKRPFVTIPLHMGCKIYVEGVALKNAASTKLKVKPIYVKFKHRDDKSLEPEVKNDAKRNEKCFSESSKIEVDSQSKPTLLSRSVSDEVERKQTHEISASLVCKPLRQTSAGDSSAILTLESAVDETCKTNSSFESGKPNGVFQEFENEKEINLTVAELFQKQKNTISTRKGDITNPVKLRSRCCSRCSDFDEPIIDIPAHQTETCHIRDLTKLQSFRLRSVNKDRTKEKKKAGIKHSKQFGVLAAEEITGITKQENYASALLNRYDKSNLQDIYVEARVSSGR